MHSSLERRSVGTPQGPIVRVSVGATAYYDRDVTIRRWPAGSGVVEFPDGRCVRGRGLWDTRAAGTEPDLAIYLLAKAPTPSAWHSVWIRWPDFRLPADERSAFAALTEAYDRSAIERVEIACGGGRGRTGCAIAVLAVLAGIDPAAAVDWTRVSYRRRAVETPWQRRWVRNLDADRIRSRG